MEIKDLRLITIEEQFTDLRILNAMAEFMNKLPAPTGVLGEIADFFRGHTLVGEALMNIPAFLERMDYMQRMVDTGLKKKISDYYRENVYITPSGICSDLQLEYIHKVLGAEHIIWAEDYPYVKKQPIRQKTTHTSKNNPYAISSIVLSSPTRRST